MEEVERSLCGWWYSWVRYKGGCEVSLLVLFSPLPRLSLTSTIASLLSTTDGLTKSGYEHPHPVPLEESDISISTLPAIARILGEEEEGERILEFIEEKEEGETLKKLKSPLNINVGGVGEVWDIIRIEWRA